MTNTNHEMLTVSELAVALRIGLTSAYALVREPGFPAIRVGSQYRIPRTRLEEWMVAQRESAPATGAESR